MRHAARPALHPGYNDRMIFLLKSEPSDYSFADLRRDKATVWSGVSNPAAVKNLREMRPGDRLVIYHTGKEKLAIGTAEVVSVDAADPKSPHVKIRAGVALPRPVPLAELKSHPLFQDSPLLKQGRLSVVPLTFAQHVFLTGG